MYCIEQRGRVWQSIRGVPLSPLQERISELCSAAVTAVDPEELERIVPELRAALQEQIAHLRVMVEDAKEVISQLPSESLSERRKTKRKAADRGNNDLEPQ